MILIELPKSIYPAEGEVSYADAERIQNQLYDEFNIEVPVKALQGKLYVRVSCHLHTSYEDIETLGKAVLIMAEPMQQ